MSVSRAVQLADLAQRLHAGQVDQQGVPYFEHCRAVAEEASKRGGKSGYVVGLFHDAVEDGRIEFPELRRHLTEDEFLAVGLLTRRPDVPYADYVLAIRDAPGAAGTLAREVKCADLHHNLGRLTPELEIRRPDLRPRYERAVEVLEAERLVT